MFGRCVIKPWELRGLVEPGLLPAFTEPNPHFSPGILGLQSLCCQEQGTIPGRSKLFKLHESITAEWKWWPPLPGRHILLKNHLKLISVINKFLLDKDKPDSTGSALKVTFMWHWDNKWGNKWNLNSYFWSGGCRGLPRDVCVCSSLLNVRKTFANIYSSQYYWIKRFLLQWKFLT